MTPGPPLGGALLRARRTALDAAARRRHRRAAAALERRHPAQRTAWAAAAARTADVHRALTQAGGGEGVAPLWARYQHDLELHLLPAPPWDVLREPTLMETMLVRGGRRTRRELRLLRERLAAERLAALLEEDPAGAPALASSRPPTSATAVHHLYHLERYAAATGRSAAASGTVVEWGGGYGGFARLLRRCAPGPPPAHVILDLPILGALQWTYLSAVLGPDAVELLLEPGAAPTPGRVAIAPSALAFDLALDAGVFVSLWGLSETAGATQDRVAAAGFFGASKLLLAHQRPGRDAPDADRLAGPAARAGARAEPVGVVRGSTYLFR